MVDREKVIKGLEHCCDPDKCDAGCPYYKYYDDVYDCMSKIAGDALELLKEQEPKTGEWILDDEDANSWECSECGNLLQINDGTPHENSWYFCPYCGAKLKEQEAKWNDG